MRKKKCRRDNVADVKKLRYPALFPADIHIIMIGVKPSDLFF